MSSSSEIANMALAHIGEGEAISNLDSDTSPEASVCRRFYTTALNALISDYDWTFARKYAAFNLVASAPNSEWGYSFRVPADLHKLRRILTGDRRITADNLVAYEVGQDASGGLIFTDVNELQARYTVKITNMAILPEMFVMAFSYYLAMLILPRMAPSDPYKLATGLRQSFLFHLSQARASDANNGQDDPEPESEFVRIRGAGGGLLDDFPRPA